MSMQEAVEEAVYMREVLEEVLGKKRRSIKLHVVTDSNSLVEAVHGHKPISNKRLRINVEIIKQALHDRDIQSVTWVSSKEMIADVLTKKGVNGVKLARILQSGNRMLNSIE